MRTLLIFANRMSEFNIAILFNLVNSTGLLKSYPNKNITFGLRYAANINDKHCGVQLLGLILVIKFPEIALWLPGLILD